MKSKCLISFLGLMLIFSMMVVSATPVISNVQITPEVPNIGDTIKICADFSNTNGEGIIIARINMKCSEQNCLRDFNWGLVMDRTSGEGKNEYSCISDKCTYCIEMTPEKMITKDGVFHDQVVDENSKIFLYLSAYDLDYSSQGKTNNYYFQYGKGVGKESATLPNIQSPSSINVFIGKIISWISGIFSNIFTKQSIVGATQVEPNTQETYQIDLTAPASDTDYSDGTASWTWGNWALVDKDGNIKQEGTWEEVNGHYQKSVTLNVPSNPSNYALVGIVVKKDATYDYITKTWTYSDDIILTKEAIDINSKYTVIAPENQMPSSLSNLISQFFTWIKNLFGF